MVGTTAGNIIELLRESSTFFEWLFSFNPLVIWITMFVCCIIGEIVRQNKIFED